MASNKAGSATLALPVLEEFDLSLPTDLTELAELIKQRKLIAAIGDRFFEKLIRSVCNSCLSNIYAGLRPIWHLKSRKTAPSGAVFAFNRDCSLDIFKRF